MSNVGKFLFDLCNEFSINILLLKLAADSCAPSLPHLSLSHTHRDIYCHTCCSSIYFYGNAFSLQVDFALVLGLGHVQMRFTVVCLPCCCCCSAALLLLRDRAAILAAHFDKWPTGSALSPLPKAAPAMATATVTPFCEDFKQAWA